MREVKIEKLSAVDFKPYGDVIDVLTGAAKGGHRANHGTAARYNYFTNLINDRKAPEAKLNVCMFRSTPQQIPFSIKLLERHKYSTQMFIPMTDKPSGFLVVCCKNNPETDSPDFSTLRVFTGNSKQAFNYHPGVILCLILDLAPSDDCS
jgi:ureidoglycolate hydrolase